MLLGLVDVIIVQLIVLTIQIKSGRVLKNLIVLQLVRKMVENNEVDSSNIRFFAGYSGWDEGQLLKEIRENSWITVPADKESCMKLSSNKELWSSFIKKMDVKYAIWTNLPADPFLN